MRFRPPDAVTGMTMNQRLDPITICARHVSTAHPPGPAPPRALQAGVGTGGGSTAATDPALHP